MSRAGDLRFPGKAIPRQDSEGRVVSRHRLFSASLYCFHDPMNSSRSVQDPCPVCGRPINRGPSADRHHWLPRSRGGRDSDAIHVVCHRKIHSVFTPKELASDYGTPEAVRAHPEIAAFVRWVRRKPPDFIDSHARPRR